MTTYSYEMNGTGAGGEIWKTTGTLNLESQGKFPELPLMAMRQSFIDLTEGKAEYGNPGKGCSGPYSVTRLLIEAVGATNEKAGET